MKYDYLIVGSGLFGAVFAQQKIKEGKRCLVLEKRNHIGGNCYTEKIEGIEVHSYGAHIFRTNSKLIWEYLSSFDEFNNFINCPIAKYKGKLYNLPFNMNTFYQMGGVTTPREALEKIEQQRKEVEGKEIINLEDKAISLVGRDVYEVLIKGYTEKQWGRSCKQLPPSIIRRLPFRLIFDNNYFNDRYQGIPIHGYTEILSKMLEGSDLILEVDFNQNRKEFVSNADKIVYTGPIDELFDYCFDPLAYRGLKFEHKILNEKNYQGVAVMNYTEREVPFTRTIEHKHFVFGQNDKTVVSWEYPQDWSVGKEPYYPINDDDNNNKYRKYLMLLNKYYPNMVAGGRLGSYKYFDMQDTISAAFNLASSF